GALTCTLSYTMSKTADQLILRPETRDSPRTASIGETPVEKMSKVVAPRDTKPDSARELTNSNPFLTRPSKPKKTAECSSSNPTGAEQARIRNRDKRF